MTEPTIKQRLADLRVRLSDLEWLDATPDLPIPAADDAAWRGRINREIARLEEYERLGYEHEPNF